MIEWVSAFLITQIIETPIYAHAIGKRRGCWAMAFAASALSHPLIFIIVPELFDGTWWRYVVLAEGIAILMETIWLRWLGIDRPLKWALLANISSLSLGLLSRWIWGWP